MVWLCGCQNWTLVLALASFEMVWRVQIKDH